MDDLNGLSWSNTSQSTQRAPNYNSAFATLKPAPSASGRVSPLQASQPPKAPAKPQTTAADSFSNLVSFSSTNSTANKNLSLQEQQKRLADLKLQQTLGAKKTLQDQYGAVDESIWNNLGSRSNTPQAQGGAAAGEDNEEDDFLAAFNKPQQPARPVPTTRETNIKANSTFDDEDDDPFGLSEFQAKQSKPAVLERSQNPSSLNDGNDDDVLGLLGRPVSERSLPRPQPPRSRSPVHNESGAHPQDRAVAELVDMGFPPEKAKQALEATESGVDVQAAVGWLLNQAHSDARERSRARNGEPAGQHESRSRVREETMTRHRDQRSATPSNDPAKAASELSSNIMKTAGSFWKQAQRKAQQAIQEFNSDSDSSQPKWMRETHNESKPQRRPTEDPDRSRDLPKQGRQAQDNNVTDEAMMLESSRPEKPSRPTQRQRPEIVFDSSADNSRDHSPAFPSRLRESHSPQPQTLKPRPPQTASSKSTLSRQAAEEQASQAYVSSARRRRPAPAASSPSHAESLEADLLGQSSPPVAMSAVVRPATVSPVPQPKRATPTPVRPPAPTRTIPAVSAIALKASHADREAGNQHFKRGDYSTAHQAYSRSLSHLPKLHPISIVLLTNRALTALKIGEPKTAVTDSDTVIAFIGPSKGENDTIDLGNGGDAPKPMRDYYGKALMRKAEALEQMEKWPEAAAVWREAVEGGHGGATSIQGRARAEKATASASASVPMSKPKPVRRPMTGSAAAATRAKAASVAKAGAAAEAAAVAKLRAQNAAADKLDDEKFALAGSVDTRISAWKGGKQDNLRALLGSLDLVLWPEAGWKKVSMADLILANKVKIQYMKGIAKVHPDKIPTSATTEQRMIAGAVFSTLNEAWDKFKTENGL